MVLGILAIYAYTRIHAGNLRNGGLTAIIAAGIMLATTQWIPGIITLVGGILSYASTHSNTQTATKQS